MQKCIDYNKFKIPLTKEKETKNTVWFHYGPPTILDLDLVKQEIEFERTSFLAYADYRLINPDCAHQIIKLNLKVPALWFPKFRLKNLISISTALDYSYHFPEEYIKFYIFPVSKKLIFFVHDFIVQNFWKATFLNSTFKYDWFLDHFLLFWSLFLLD